MELFMMGPSEARPAEHAVSGHYSVPRVYIVVPLAIAAWAVTLGLGVLLWSLVP